MTDRFQVIIETWKIHPRNVQKWKILEQGNGSNVTIICNDFMSIFCVFYTSMKFTFKANWNIGASPKICRTIICKQQNMRPPLRYHAYCFAWAYFSFRPLLCKFQCCHFPCYNTNPVFLSWPLCWEFLLRVVTRNPKFPCFQRIPKKSSIFDQKLGIFVKKYVFSAKIFHSKSLIKIFFLKFVFSNGKYFCHKFWKKFVTFFATLKKNYCIKMQ